jgi:hypothetical protein
MIRKSMPSGFDPMVGTGFPKRSCSGKKHDPEKWVAVFRKDHAPAKSMIRKSMPSGFDPMVGTGFPKRSCSTKKAEATRDRVRGECRSQHGSQ